MHLTVVALMFPSGCENPSANVANELAVFTVLVLDVLLDTFLENHFIAVRTLSLLVHRPVVNVALDFRCETLNTLYVTAPEF